jgi:hypothetical protein
VSQAEYNKLKRDYDHLLANYNAIKSGSTSTRIGDIVRLGAHDWRVLDVQDGKALIITENIIDFRAYHNTWSEVTWAHCNLRAYLNETFIETFSAAERARIVDTLNVNKGNHWLGTPGGVDTTDKIFLLSLEEVVMYFGDSGQLTGGNPDSSHWIDDRYHNSRKAVTEKDCPGYESSYPAGTPWIWWLRSPGGENRSAAVVYYDGWVYVNGESVSFDIVGVRPALWLDLS